MALSLSPLDPPDDAPIPCIDVDGVPVPVPMAVQAVRACVDVIQFCDTILDTLGEDYEDDGSFRSWVEQIKERLIPERPEDSD